MRRAAGQRHVDNVSLQSSTPVAEGRGNALRRRRQREHIGVGRDEGAAARKEVGNLTAFRVTSAIQAFYFIGTVMQARLDVGSAHKFK